jgi:hypothetical protein
LPTTGVVFFLFLLFFFIFFSLMWVSHFFCHCLVTTGAEIVKSRRRDATRK